MTTNYIDIKKIAKILIGSRKSDYVVVLVLVILLILRFIVLPAVTGTDIPIAVVEGKSMFPTLREGDLVFIVKTPPNRIHEGDIIVYEYHGKYIVHRVIEVIKEGDTYYYVTKGDNNPIPDPYYKPGVPYGKVKGKVFSIGDSVFKLPYIGYYAIWFNRD